MTNTRIVLVQYFIFTIYSVFLVSIPQKASAAPVCPATLTMALQTQDSFHFNYTRTLQLWQSIPSKSTCVYSNPDGQLPLSLVSESVGSYVTPPCAPSPYGQQQTYACTKGWLVCPGTATLIFLNAGGLRLSGQSSVTIQSGQGPTYENDVTSFHCFYDSPSSVTFRY